MVQAGLLSQAERKFGGRIDGRRHRGTEDSGVHGGEEKQPGKLTNWSRQPQPSTPEVVENKSEQWCEKKQPLRRT